MKTKYMFIINHTAPSSRAWPYRLQTRFVAAILVMSDRPSTPYAYLSLRRTLKMDKPIQSCGQRASIRAGLTTGPSACEPSPGRLENIAPAVGTSA